MVIVHHLNNSRSQRVLWLLEELEVPYTVKRYERDRTTMLAPPELKQVHPLGKSPVIEDGGRVYAESGAIVEHLAETYGGGRLVPTERDARERYRYWMHFAEGSMMTPLLLKLFAGRLGDAGAPLSERADGQIALLLGYVEAELGDRPFFAGEAFSAADVQMSFPLEACAARGGLTATSYPRLSSFLDRIHARDAYKRALERGGPYEILR
jgi:glutathione S-transferase